MKIKTITTQIEVFESLKDLPIDEQLLLENAFIAKEDAYAPYSKFKVGAALVLSNNEIVTGNNQENAAYPSGLCAERVAAFYAGAKFPKVPIKKLAITASAPDYILNKPVAPCGACRQSLLEYETLTNEEITILLTGEIGVIYRIKGIKQLLPLCFGQDSLLKGGQELL